MLFRSGLGGIITTIKPKQSFSEMENRVLSSFPTFRWDKLISGEYTTGIEGYLNDHIVLRNFWVQTNTVATYFIGMREKSEIYFGRDQTLYDKTVNLDLENMRQISDCIDEFKMVHPEFQVSFGIIPDASAVVEKGLPFRAPKLDQKKIIDQIYEQSNVTNVDFFTPLYNNRSQYVYYKTDHHWTSEGAYLGYKAFQEALGESFYELSYYLPSELTTEFYGTLYSKAPLPWQQKDTITAYVPDKEVVVTTFDGTQYSEGTLYTLENLFKKDKYSVFLGGNVPLVQIKTELETERKIVIVRDSFMDSMVPFLTKHYKEIHLIDPRYYKASIASYMEENDMSELFVCLNIKQLSESTGVTYVLR